MIKDDLQKIESHIGYLFTVVESERLLADLRRCLETCRADAKAIMPYEQTLNLIREGVVEVNDLAVELGVWRYSVQRILNHLETTGRIGHKWRPARGERGGTRAKVYFIRENPNATKTKKVGE